MKYKDRLEKWIKETEKKYCEPTSGFCGTPWIERQLNQAYSVHRMMCNGIMDENGRYI